MGWRTLTTGGAQKTDVSIGPKTTTITTTGNIDNLDFNGADVLYCNNASDATIDGLLAGVDGQLLTIVSIGAGNVYLAHQNTGSSAAHRLLNPVTTAALPLVAGFGSATYRYDAVTARWRQLDYDMGGVLNVAYSAGNFSADGGGTWTVDSGDQAIYRYTIVRNVIILTVQLQATTIAGTVTDVRVKVPGGFTPFGGEWTGIVYDNSTSVATVADQAVSGTQVAISRLDGSNLAASTNNTYFRLHGAIVLQ